MKQSESLAYAEGYKAGLERAWAIFRKIDQEHPEYPMPMELTGRMARAKGEVEDYLYERGEE